MPFLIAFAAGSAIAHSPGALKAANAAPPAVTFKMTHMEGEPMVVRILYLDDGTREIIVPPLPIRSPDAGPAPEQTQPDAAQVIVISNTDQGVQGVVLEP